MSSFSLINRDLNEMERNNKALLYQVEKLPNIQNARIEEQKYLRYNTIYNKCSTVAIDY